MKIQNIGNVHNKYKKNDKFVERKLDCFLNGLCYNSHELKINVGVKALKKLATFLGMLLTLLIMCPTGVMAAGSGESDCPGTGLALYSICRTSFMYCDHAAGKSRVVGSTSATGSTYVDLF